MMVNKSGIILLSAIVLANSFFLLEDSYFTNSNVGWERPRQIGEAFDGYWYSTFHGEGCFKSSTVVFVKGNETYAVRGDKQATVSNSIVQRKNKVVVTVRLGENKVNTLFHEDHGNALVLERTISRVNGKKVADIVENRITLKTCDNPSTKGMFLSLFRKVYEPRIVTQKLTQR